MSQTRAQITSLALSSKANFFFFPPQAVLEVYACFHVLQPGMYCANGLNYN